MRSTKKILCMLLALALVMGLMPATALATGGDQVYISVSFDGEYIDGKNGNPMVYIPVSFDEIESIDLNEYGLSEYLYDPDGDGTYETTALQLIIYAHENIYGGSWSDVNFTGGAGSSYFQGGIFGFTENLNYFLNGEFPIDEALSEGSSFAVGATSDHIILEAGDFIDIASFTSYAFLWDSAAGFHLFADANDGFVHSYTAETGKPLSVKLLRSYSNMADGTPVLTAESGYVLKYGTVFGTADGTVTTDDSGCAEITFNTAGTYYLWCNGNYGIDSAPNDIVSSPAYATVTVTGETAAPEQPDTPEEKTDIIVSIDEGMDFYVDVSCCDECYTALFYSGDDPVTSVNTTIDKWECEFHGANPPAESKVNNIAVSVSNNEKYLVKGATINGNYYAFGETEGSSAEYTVGTYAVKLVKNQYNSAIYAANYENGTPEDITIHIHVQEEQEEVPEDPREAQDVSSVLNATMAQMAATVTEPAFGTTAGEWTVFGLARGGYYAKDNAYFTDYYDRIVETVNTTAASVNLNGALHKSKSTDNSRLIVALSAIGKDATSVGDWDLVEAYSANGFDWIKKQGINGSIWALIALDSNNYATTDTTIRQQCVDSIVSLQHDDGGWSLMANKTYASDPDITGMALTALYPYRDQPAVAEACAEALACLSGLQHDNGTFASGGAECSESCAWVITACTAWGINPDTDSRFIKNGNSVVDGLLAHYVEEEAMFQHVIGGGANAMATDQSCYALVAYNRYINNQSALFDYSDVTFDAAVPGTPTVVPDGTITATLTVPSELNNEKGTTFNATIQIDEWKNDAGYKLIDFEMSVPAGLKVTGVTAGSRLAGGTVNYNLAADGKLRCAYFDANENADLTVSGEDFPVEIFAIGFEIEEKIEAESLRLSITGMSVKLGSDSTDAGDIVVVDTVGKTEDGEGGEGGGDTGNTGTGTGNIGLVEGMSCSAVCLYTGAGVDLIPADKKAVAVSVTKIENGPRLTYNDGTNEVEFLYNAAISEKIGVCTYIALVDSSMEMTNFMNESYYTVGTETAGTLTFGDTNEDATVNAQDALAVVNAWLRKAEAPAEKQILAMNVNGDGNINTFDALGVVEAFVNIDNTYVIVTNAASAFSNVSAEASTETP